MVFDNSKGKQQGEEKIAFNWCLHQVSAICLPKSSPRCNDGKRIHFSLREWEIDDPEMELCEMRYGLRLEAGLQLTADWQGLNDIKADKLGGVKLTLLDFHTF